MCLLLLVAGCGAAQVAGPRECPPGDVLVQVEADAAALAGCREVKGRLAIGPSFGLRALVGLDRIERVGSLDVSDNVELGGLFLPGLVEVAGDVLVDNNLAMATASLHHLIEVRGDLIVRRNRSLQRLDLGALRRVGGALAIEGHPELDTVVLDRLESTGHVVLEDDPAWPAADMESVRDRAREKR